MKRIVKKVESKNEYKEYLIGTKKGKEDITVYEAIEQIVTDSHEIEEITKEQDEAIDILARWIVRKYIKDHPELSDKEGLIIQ